MLLLQACPFAIIGVMGTHGVAEAESMTEAIATELPVELGRGCRAKTGSKSTMELSGKDIEYCLLTVLALAKCGHKKGA
jgi:hypothetical protein